MGCPDTRQPLPLGGTYAAQSLIDGELQPLTRLNGPRGLSVTPLTTAACSGASPPS